MSTEVPDGGWGWYVVLATFITTGLSAGNFYSFGVLFAAFLDAFGGTKAETAWIGSILGLMFVFGTSFSNALVKKVGHRRTVMVAGTITTIGLLSSSFATSLYQLYITYGCIAGIGMGLAYIPCVDLTGKYFKKKISIAIGLGMAGTGAGQFTLSLSTQLMVDTYGWRGMLLILSAVTANICVAGALLRPVEMVLHKPLKTIDGSPLTAQQLSNGTAVLGQEVTPSNELTFSKNGVTTYDLQQYDKMENREQKRKCVCYGRMCACLTSFFSSMIDKELLTNPVFLLHVLLGVGQSLGHSIVSAHVVRRLRDFGISNTQSSLVAAVMGLAQLTGRPIYGAIANSGRVKPNVLYAIAMGTCGAASLLSIYVRNFAAQLVYIIAFGASLGGYVIMIPIVVILFHGKEKLGHGMSLVIQVHGIVTLLSSPLAGHMRDTYGEYDQVFWVVVSAYLCSTIVALLLPAVDRMVKKRQKSNKFEKVHSGSETETPGEIMVYECISTV